MRQSPCPVEVGQQVVRRPVSFPVFLDGMTQRSPSLDGRVVYVHPERRYHTVEFSLPGGVVRESFPGV